MIQKARKTLQDTVIFISVAAGFLDVNGERGAEE
jgi:hypothetical protein